MSKKYNLERFIKAQESKFQDAMEEVKNGRKITHWIWYIFPQISGLGFSEISKYYAIEDLEEANLYLEHKILGKRLIEISKVLIEINGKTANDILGSLDDLKLKSCMTLFNSINKSNSIFEEVLAKYFNNERDNKTIKILTTINK